MLLFDGDGGEVERASRCASGVLEVYALLLNFQRDCEP
jgi:hypothetical protein